MDWPGSPSTLAKAILGVGLRGRAAGRAQLLRQLPHSVGNFEELCGNHPAYRAPGSTPTSSILAVERGRGDPGAYAAPATGPIE